MKLSTNKTLEQANTAYKKKEFELAESLYREILKDKPSHPDTSHNLGILLASLNKHTEALSLFKTATKNNDTIEQYWISYINFLIQQKNFVDAEIISKKALEFHPKSPLIYLNFGSILFTVNRPYDASVKFKKAIELQPEFAEAHFNLGILFYKFGKFNEAITSYKKSIKLKPDYADAHNNLGNTLFELNKFDEAEKYYKKTIELKPDYAEAYNNLGNTLRKLKRLDEAEINHKKAIEIVPNYGEAHCSLGITLYMLKRLDEAVVNLTKAINIDISIEAQFHRANILFEKKNFDLALNDYDNSKTAGSNVRALTCLLALNQIDKIYERIEVESKVDKNKEDLRLAAFSSFISYKEKKDTKNNFCNRPIDFINFSNLSSHVNNTNLFIDELVKELLDRRTDWEPTGKATIKGFQSKSDLFEEPKGKLKNLKKIIINELSLYFSKFNRYDCTLIQKWPSKKDLVGWYVDLKKQGYQDSHMHSSGWVSGVIYLKVVPPLKKDEGAIEFSINGENYFDKNSPKKIYQPKIGDIVIFPSSLHHRTIPFTSETNRIIVSFDLLQNQNIFNTTSKLS